MAEHLLLPGVDTVEEVTLQIHQDVVTCMLKAAQLPVSVCMLVERQILPTQHSHYLFPVYSFLCKDFPNQTTSAHIVPFEPKPLARSRLVGLLYFLT